MLSFMVSILCHEDYVIMLLNIKFFGFPHLPYVGDRFLKWIIVGCEFLLCYFFLYSKKNLQAAKF
jgi:hypothetical protein